MSWRRAPRARPRRRGPGDRCARSNRACRRRRRAAPRARHARTPPPRDRGRRDGRRAAGSGNGMAYRLAGSGRSRRREPIACSGIPARAIMAIESDLYHPEPFRPRAPGRQLLGSDGRPRADRGRAAPGRPRGRRWRSSAAATPACPRPTTWPATMASRRSCSRRARSAGAPRAAMAGSAAWAAASSATDAMAQRYGVPEAARFFAAQKAGVGAGPRASPPTKASISSPRARASISWPIGRTAGTCSRTSPAPCSGCSASGGSCGARPRWRSGCCARPRRRAAWSCRTISACIRCATCVGWRRPPCARGARSTPVRR